MGCSSYPAMGGPGGAASTLQDTSLLGEGLPGLDGVSVAGLCCLQTLVSHLEIILSQVKEHLCTQVDSGYGGHRLSKKGSSFCCASTNREVLFPQLRSAFVSKRRPSGFSYPIEVKSIARTVEKIGKRCSHKSSWTYPFLFMIPESCLPPRSL